MAASIYFVDDPAVLRLDLTGSVLCLHHPDYVPVPITGAVTMPFPDFLDRYKIEPALYEADNIVFVGTNRIITPSSRTDPVFELLFTGVRMNKISVDTCPFISVPWRTWFHFGITNRPYGRYDYSYAAETDWHKARDGISDYDPFSLDEMLAFSNLDGAVSVRRGAYFTGINVVTVDVQPDIIAQYNDLRDELFETQSSIKPVLRKLAQFARAHCPQRRVPQPHTFFRRPTGQTIVKTNLKIDDYLAGQLLDLMHLTNNYLEALRE